MSIQIGRSVRKKWLFAAAMALLAALLFVACREAPRALHDPTPAIRQLYADMAACRIQATLSADYGDRVDDFQVRYTWRRDAAGEVEILAPAEVAGLKAVLDGRTSTLQYGEVALETGLLPGTGLSPVEGLAEMLRTLREGYQTAWGREKYQNIDCVLMEFTAAVGDVTILRRIYVERKSGLPVYAEIFADGQRVLTCRIETVEKESA